jgi:glycosyltransferase involved in cell wall biosynthesis
VAPLRVCLWAPVPPPEGGISRWTVRYCSEAPKFGLEVPVVDTALRSASFTERSHFSLSRMRAGFRALSELQRVLRRERPHAAHITTSLFWATPRDMLALWLCRLHGVPAVLNIRASSQIVTWREGLGPLRRLLLDIALRSAAAITVLSRELRGYLECSIPSLRVRLIPNMVSVNELGSQVRTADYRIPPRRAKHRVLYAGFRTPLKGVGDLADAVLGLDDCELILAGGDGEAADPAMRARMEASLQQLRRAGRLMETGILAADELLSLYRQVDLFVLPTYREGLPNVLLEAMAAGLACIATPVGAIPDVLTTDCGVLVPVADPSALRNAIRELLCDDTRRHELGARAQLRISEHYSTDAVMTAYRSLYSEFAL